MVGVDLEWNVKQVSSEALDWPDYGTSLKLHGAPVAFVGESDPANV